MKSNTISTVLSKIDAGESIGWMPTKTGQLICWRKDNNNGEITVYESVGGSLKGSKLNSPIDINVKRNKVPRAETEGTPEK